MIFLSPQVASGNHDPSIVLCPRRPGHYLRLWVDGYFVSSSRRLLLKSSAYETSKVPIIMLAMPKLTLHSLATVETGYGGYVLAHELRLPTAGEMRGKKLHLRKVR